MKPLSRSSNYLLPRKKPNLLSACNSVGLPRLTVGQAKDRHKISSSSLHGMFLRVLFVFFPDKRIKRIFGRSYID